MVPSVPAGTKTASKENRRPVARTAVSLVSAKAELRRSLAFVQILAGIRIGAMTRGHDRSERIAAGAFRVTHRAGELGGMFLGGRVRRHQRVLQRTLLDAEGGVAARRSDTQAVHARAGAGGDEAADDH